MDWYYMLGIVIIPSVFNAIWAAFKYYSNTLGNNPESFDVNKFAPFVVLGIFVSLYTALTAGDVTSVDQVLTIMGQNLGYLVTINLAIEIVRKSAIWGRLRGGSLNVS